MKCPRCRFETPSDAEFCPECGAKLVLACAQCGTANAPGHKFCKKCGQPLASAAQTPIGTRFAAPQAYTPKHLAEKILTSRSALEGERKQVTVLFADLKGSMELLADRDPEEARKLLDPVLERMMEAVHRYEGTVNQVMGDGIMALFGAPVAHEDHGVRACYAALDMQAAIHRYADEVWRAHGISLEIRVGLNSGEVVVRAIGSDLHMDYTAVGQTTHLAARMEQLATGGKSLLTADTLRLAEGYVEVRPLGPVPVKGLEAPIEVYEMIGAGPMRSRLHAAAARGLTRFVGRESELEQLRQALGRAAAGHGQVVAIVGEPGVGKSRLVWEVTHSHRTHGWLTLQASSVSYGKATPYLPAIDLLKTYFKIEERDDQRAIREKLIGKLLALDDALKPTLSALLGLLDVPIEDPQWDALDAPQRRRRTLDAVKRLLLRESQGQPLLVVFEDLHWIDSETQALLDGLVESLPATRLLLLVNYRPEYQHGWGSKTYYTQLRLDPLPPENAHELLHALLGTDPGPQPVKQLLIERTEGNPFFLEESVRMLVETKVLVGERGSYRLAEAVSSVQVPATVQAVLAARIDRLPSEEKVLLQTASVIGKDVPFALLKAIADLPEAALQHGLAHLQASEFLYETSLFPDLEHTFKHALTHEVAYNSLLVQRRRELHRVIALAIEKLYGDRLAEHYDVLAHHFTRAEQWSRAFTYLLKAGERAAKAFASREAVALYDHALEVADRLGGAVELKARMTIHQAKGDLYFVLSDFALCRAENERLFALARRVGDRMTQGAALAGMGWASLYAHEFDPALEYSRQAIQVAQGGDAKPVLAAAHLTAGFVYAARGQLGQATDEVDVTRAISHSVGDVVHESLSLGLAGFLKNFQGEYAEAARLLSESLRIAREYNLLIPLLDALFCYGVTLTGKGDYDEALAMLDEGLALSGKVGDELWHHRILNSLGWLHIELGDLERAIDLNRRAAEGARKRGDHEPMANAEINLGDIFLANGDLASAQEVLDGVHQLVHDPATSEWGRWRYSTHLFASLAELWLARGDLTRAREFVRQCLEIATRTNSRKSLVKGWRLTGEIAIARREWDEAENALGQGLTLAQAVGNPTQLWKTYFALGRLYAETKKRDKARQAHQAARQVIEQIKLSLKHAGLRESLQSAPLVRQVYDASAPG